MAVIFHQFFNLSYNLHEHYVITLYVRTIIVSKISKELLNTDMHIHTYHILLVNSSASGSCAFAAYYKVEAINLYFMHNFDI